MFALLGPVLGLVAGVSEPSDSLESSSSEQSAESWSYYYHHESDNGSSWQQFSGLADSDGNLYWLFCSIYGRVFVTYGCTLHSSDRDGNSRFDVRVGEGPSAITNINLYLVAGSIVVTELNAVLQAGRLPTARCCGPTTLAVNIALFIASIWGVAYDGDARVVVVAGSSLFALSVTTGETIWRRGLREDARGAGFWGRPILDESGNIYCSKHSAVVARARARVGTSLPHSIHTARRGSKPRLIPGSNPWRSLADAS